MAMVLEPFVSKLADLVFDLVREEVGMLLGVPGEILKLSETLGDIRAVLADAVGKRAGAEQINKWLVDLKDVMYDADDILDELLIAAAEKRSGVQLGQRPRSSPPLTSSSSSVSRRFSDLLPNLLSCCRNPVLTHEIGKRIKSLNLRFDEISARKSRLNLLTLPPRQEENTTRGASGISKHTSYLMEPDIVGTQIEEDTRVVVEWLTREDDDRQNQQQLLVYGIVGMGGIGKTTLAQKIYNDQSIIDHFSRMWVCVSQDFGEDRLLKDIISSAGGDYGRAEGRTLLEPILESMVRGKKFLLVLDDVWDENVWDDLIRKPLWSGGFGSRILVTTRNEAVAHRMKAADILRVGELSPEDGWSLLRTVVVSPGKEREIEELKGIGMGIVEQCGRLPLAIKVVGGVLLRKKNRTARSVWMEVLRSSAWSVTGLPQGIHEALYLSYEALPPHLKQCFLFCSLFPEDYVIRKEILVMLWIAEGFVKVDEGEGSSLIEDVGEDYYWELVSRNLLQHLNDGEERCRMHDLVRSLSQFLTRDECLVVKGAQGLISAKCTNLSMKPRHLSMIQASDNDKDIVNIPTGFGSLRTIVFFNGMHYIFDLVDTFEKIRRLRVLDLSFSNSITELPDSIGSLVHLRYINLGYSKISALPESIGNLKNLQFLILIRCDSLRGLPKGVENLQELRCLDASGTGFLEGIPVGVGGMQQLNTLRGFRLHRNSSSVGGWCTLEDLRPLIQLRELTIDSLEYYESSCSPREGGGGVLVNKPNLKSISLEISMQEFVGDEVVVKRLEEVFEKQLCPPSCVEMLRVGGYYGRRFPSWMMVVPQQKQQQQQASSISVALSNLTQLTLSGCRHCEQLPPLGQLPHLDYLCIQGADAVVRIGAEFLACNSGGGGGGGGHATTTLIPPSFPKLKKLAMNNMPNWEEWQWEAGEAAMPLLEDFILNNCPKLRSLPHGLIRHATALKSLEISGARSLRAVENLHSLRDLTLWSSGVERISDLPVLLKLAVYYPSGRLPEVYNLGKEMRLMELYDEGMESLPDWLVSDGGIEIAESGELHIGCSEQLFKRIREQGQQDGIQVQDMEDGRIVLHPQPYQYLLNIRKPRTIYVYG